MHLRPSSPILTLVLVALSFSCGNENTSETGAGGEPEEAVFQEELARRVEEVAPAVEAPRAPAARVAAEVPRAPAARVAAEAPQAPAARVAAEAPRARAARAAPEVAAEAARQAARARAAPRAAAARAAPRAAAEWMRARQAAAGTSGAAGSGGMDAGSAGRGGMSGAGGSGGTDGGTVGDAGPSTGCGKAAPPQVSTRQTIDVGGTAREYIVNYPTPYDPNRPYRVLYIHHGRGGNAEQNITRNGGWYGVGPLSGGSTIFVSPHGIGDGTETGWPNTGGRDVAFIRALVTQINSTFCVDTSRIFTTGMSYGGNFSNTLGCQMGDVFRAIVPFAGWGPQGGNCVGKVAALVTHGTTDTTIEIGRGGASRDHWSAANHCTTTSAPYDPSPCVVYQGCDVGYPVGWCEHPGGHILPTFSGPAIWNFISQF